MLRTKNNDQQLKTALIDSATDKISMSMATTPFSTRTPSDTVIELQHQNNLPSQNKY
jgi:hypothetical protein